MLARNDWEEGSSNLTWHDPTTVMSSGGAEYVPGLVNAGHSMSRGKGKGGASDEGLMDQQAISYQQILREQQVQGQRSAVYYQLGTYVDALWRSISSRIISGEWKAAKLLRVQKVSATVWAPVS